MARRLGRLLGAGVTTTLLGLGALVGAGPAAAETVFATELLDRLVAPAAGTTCRYALEWPEVKYRWGLTVDPAEEAALVPALLTCGSSPVQVPARADVPTPGGQVLGHTLRGGQRMTGGQALRSPDGRYRLEMQTDGNLVCYAPGNRVLWSSGIWGRPGTVLEVQADGNVVLYDRAGRPL